MKINLEKQDKLIERLGKITSSIKSIYEKMNSSIENKEEYKKLEEYLDIAIEVEDNIYSEIGQKQAESEQFLNRLIYQINCSDLKEKEAIINRIIGYISTRKYLNPFKPLETNPLDYMAEVQNNIRNQANLDYLKGIFTSINQELEKKPNKRKKQKLIKAKNSLLFSNKMMEKLSKNERNLKIDGRERCIIFNNPEQTVTVVYCQYVSDIVNYCATIILTKKEAILEEIELKSALALLTPNEIEQLKDQINAFLEINGENFDDSNIERLLKLLDENQSAKTLQKSTEKKQP